MPKIAKKQTLNQKIRAASKDLKALNRDLDKTIKTQARLELKVKKASDKVQKLSSKAQPTV